MDPLTDIDLFQVIISFLNPCELLAWTVIDQRTYSLFNSKKILNKLCYNIKIRYISRVNSFKDLNQRYQVLHYYTITLSYEKILEIAIEEKRSDLFFQIGELSNGFKLEKQKVDLYLIQMCLCGSYKMFQKALRLCHCDYSHQHKYLRKYSGYIFDETLGIKSYNSPVCVNIIAYTIIKNLIKLDLMNGLDHIKESTNKTKIRKIYLNIASFRNVYPEHLLMEQTIRYYDLYHKVWDINSQQHSS